MKTVFIFLFGLIVLPSLGAQADLGSSLGKGDATGVASHFGTKVELSLTGREYTVGKSEAERHLREFFAAHQAKGFRAVHRGTSKDNDSNYTIGELVTDKGIFRVYTYFQQEGDRRVVRELRIEL